MNVRTSVAALCLAGLLIGYATVSRAQSVPPMAAPLAGTWTLSAESDGVGPLGPRFTITHDDRSITFTSGDEVVTHRLDGAPSTYSTQTPRGTVTHTSEARWVSNALVISIRSSGRIGSWGGVLVCSIDHAGQLQVVEVAELAMQGQRMGTRVLTYTRTGPG